MNADRVTYLDSSAIVKLVIEEPESGALRRFLQRRRPYATSALARMEVARALMPLGPEAVRHGEGVLSTLNLIRVSDRVLRIAGEMMPPELRSLDAIHLATALVLGVSLSRLVTYDDRLGSAANARGWTVVAPK